MYIISPPLSAGVEQPSVPNFEKGGSEKEWVPAGDLKSSCHRYLLERFYYDSSQKKLFKISFSQTNN